MEFDILIPTSGKKEILLPLLQSLAAQTLQPQRVVLLLHIEITQDAYTLWRDEITDWLEEEFSKKIEVISHLTHDYTPGRWRGHDRNILLAHAQAPYIRMIDHDNVCPPDMCAQTCLWYQGLQATYDLLVVSPTIMRADTWEIQSQWITWFSFLLPQYTFGKIESDRQEVVMIGGNSLFGPAELFREFGFDERFGRCYEDIDMSYRMTHSGIAVLVLNTVYIEHREAYKSPLANLFLWTDLAAYERARNRIWFVKKNATRWQKIQYFCCGLRLQTGWFLFVILRRWGEKRSVLWWAVLRGTRTGLSST